MCWPAALVWALRGQEVGRWQSPQEEWADRWIDGRTDVGMGGQREWHDVHGAMEKLYRETLGADLLPPQARLKKKSAVSMQSVTTPVLGIPMTLYSISRASLNLHTVCTFSASVTERHFHKFCH